MRKIIAVDVDDVCADLLGEWLRRYNEVYNDSLLPEDISEWDLSKAVKPECGKKIYSFLTEAGFYHNVLPIPRARMAVKRLESQGYRIVYVSSCVIGTIDEKVQWLQRWGFLPGGSTAANFIAATDKSLIGADALVDDRIKNVEAFPRAAFLVTRPHNAGLLCSRPRICGLHALSEKMLEEGA